MPGLRLPVHEDPICRLGRLGLEHMEHTDGRSLVIAHVVDRTASNTSIYIARWEFYWLY